MLIPHNELYAISGEGISRLWGRGGGIKNEQYHW